MRSDYRGKLFHLSRILGQHLSRDYYSVLCNSIAIIKGIKIGYKNRFIGYTYFRRYPFSSISIGNNCVFRSSISSNLIGINHRSIISTLNSKAKIEIGSNCGFSGTVIGAAGEIIIKDNVRCGANTIITDSDWHLDDPRIGVIKPVIIEDNVWLGVNVIVLKGVRIGKNSIIGANSVVTKNIPMDVVAAGNPCKIIRNLL